MMQYGFIHIPKTGGSTLQDIINRNYKKSDLANLKHDGSSTDSISNAKLLKGHVDIRAFKQINPDIGLLSCVRSPLSRLVSHYAFICKREHHGNHRQIMDNGYSIIDCIEQKVDTVFDNLLIRYIGGYRDLPFGEIKETHLETAIKNIHEFVWIGVLEDFDNSVLMLQKELDWGKLYYRKRKVNASSKQLISSLNSKEMSLLKSSQSLDQKLYSAILEIHKEKLAANKDYVSRKMRSLQFRNKLFSGIMSWKND
jgi:hypothetical protein